MFSDVVLNSHAVPNNMLPQIVKSNRHILCLRFISPLMTDKRRISHDIAQLLLRHDVVPVEPDSIALCDIDIGLQRQEVLIEAVDQLLRLLQHLGFRDPQRSLRYRHGEVIDLNAVELLDGYPDQATVLMCEGHLPCGLFIDDPVLQAAKTEITFRKKISASGSFTGFSN